MLCASNKQTVLLSDKDGAPLEVPEGFWTGGKKLAWPVDDLSTIYGAFPTFNIGFATQEDANMEFSLAVTPQVRGTLYLKTSIVQLPGAEGNVLLVHTPAVSVCACCTADLVVVEFTSRCSSHVV